MSEKDNEIKSLKKEIENHKAEYNLIKERYDRLVEGKPVNLDRDEKLKKDKTKEELIKTSREAVKNYNELLRDFRVQQELTTEFGRLLGYYKTKYHEYRENIRKLSSWMSVEVPKLLNISKEKFEEVMEASPVILDPTDKPLLPMYDVSKEVMDERDVKKLRDHNRMMPEGKH